LGGGRITDKRLEREIRLAYMVALWMLGAVFVTSVGATLYVIGVTHERAVDLSGATKSIRTLHEGMLDQETGLRGYLVTRQPRFLEPYDRGRDIVLDQARGLTSDLSSEGELVEQVVELRLAAENWMRFAEASRAEDVLTRAELVSTFDAGKALFDDYRGVQNGLTDTIVGARDDALRNERTALIASGVLQTLVLAIAVGLFRNRFRKLRPRVITPLIQIEETIERIRRGDETARVTPDGVLEIRSVGSGLNEMAQAVQQKTELAASREAELRQYAESLAQILRLAREISGNLNTRYVQQTVAEACIAVSGYRTIVIYLLDEEERVLVPAHDSRGPVERNHDRTVPLGNGVAGQAGALGRLIRLDDEGLLALPMVVGARVVGVLEFRDPSSPELSQDTIGVLETLAIHSATALEAARLHEATKEMSVIDALTRLPNRRRFDQDMALEISRSLRYGRPLGLIMLDVDHFKELNDLYGHQAGDEVLQELGSLLAGTVRTSDTAYRYGGEEFAILIREGGLDEARDLAERVRAEVERRFAGWRKDRGITISLGVAAQSQGEMDDPAELIAAADAALYAAKEAGRNTVRGTPSSNERQAHIRPVR
jgi:diguanylate cyclase (GGDEF)-like protein